ncbi:T9SS type B sorting domain-containing protein [Tamlana sp. I1]|uniref:T9SS type B sorting domain-containing protein n=1 Tax=Tamlana sp. I1 TaxID=2762061 RepID=UPI001890349E|nr:T9SS type B sorting domain-containing protein [Tamlana sp. I1]
MPKIGCFFIVLYFLKLQGFSQNTYVPDPNFEQVLIDLGLDSGPLDSFVPTANISGITDLDVAQKNIQDLTGIEDFLALKNLDCSDNLLTVLNISANTNLTELYCSNNLISVINVNPIDNLIRLWCFNNGLQNLDVSKNTKLISLRCENNDLSVLNISNNLNLNVLVCSDNNLTAIDVSTNTILSRFECSNNLLLNLELSTNTILGYLACENNLLTSLNLSKNNELNVVLCFNNAIKSLDFSQNKTLSDLDCSYNELCQLNIKNGNNMKMTSVNFSGNPILNCVVVDNPQADFSTWQPSSFPNYVNSNEACKQTVPVDVLNDYFGQSYQLPIINNGNYFTASGGMGTPLFAGDLISTSQSIYIYNEINCYSNESVFNVIISAALYYIPKYFTPNNDGQNDVWQILDASNHVNTISIYNRYGKLIKFLPPNSSGWDGQYRGQPMSSDSYWYEMVLNSGEIVRGCFALKR